MRFLYRCASCRCGFWQDKEIEDNNLECPHCGAEGYESEYVEDLNRWVPKLHRIQIATNKKGEIELPSYSFECGKCGNEFGVFRLYRKKHTVKCPKCRSGYEKLREIFGVPYVISDISHTEGRTGEDLDMSHALGDGVTISSRRQLAEYKRLTRDRYFHNTDGSRRVLKPFVDPDSGKITMDYVTVKSNGIDLGEIHEVDETTVRSKQDIAKEMEKDWVELEKKAAAQVEVE